MDQRELNALEERITANLESRHTSASLSVNLNIMAGGVASSLILPLYNNGDTPNLLLPAVIGAGIVGTAARVLYQREPTPGQEQNALGTNIVTGLGAIVGGFIGAGIRLLF